MNFDWFTLGWLMHNLNWIILFLLISIIILFLFPILLGYDLYEKDKKNKWLMKPNLILIICLIITSVFFFISEIIGLKKEVRQLKRKINYLINKKNNE